MVRLVFRPFTQVRRSICTLESLRTSTRVSPGFALLRKSSPSFGSQHVCSHSNLSPEGSWSVDSAAYASYLGLLGKLLLSFRAGESIPSTRTHVRLLGPCFKTGWWEAFRQSLSSAWQTQETNCTLVLSRTPKKAWLHSRGDHDCTHCYPSVPFQQFQVLFHSLFKVLFIFPSRYLFAIGLPSIFSFRWNLPPIRAAIPNNSTRREPADHFIHSMRTGLSPSTAGHSRPLYRTNSMSMALYRLQFRRFSVWAISASLAVTREILVSFFSSA